MLRGEAIAGRRPTTWKISCGPDEHQRSHRDRQAAASARRCRRRRGSGRGPRETVRRERRSAEKQSGVSVAGRSTRLSRGWGALDLRRRPRIDSRWAWEASGSRKEFLMRKVLLVGAASLLGVLGFITGVASAVPSPPTPNAGCIPRVIADLGPPGLAVASSGQRGLDLVQGGIVAAATTPHDACL
jgi:hypothetical protein